MPRGRLIFPFLAELYRHDTYATATVDPDGPGPLTSGFDPDFQESVVVDVDNYGIGEPIRKEHPPIRVPCQVESKTFEELQMFPSGHSPRSKIILIFHFKDLERLQLVDKETGDALIRVNDRLGALLDIRGNLVQAFRNPSGLYVTEARPIGFGLSRSRPQRNLLFVTFEDRQQAVRSMG